MPASQAVRLSRAIWEREKLWDEFLSILSENSAAVDEVTLFPIDCHVPPTFDQIQDTIPLLYGRLQQLRWEGWRAGINVLATSGHHEESLAHALQGDFQRVMDLSGRLCRGAFCVNDAAFREEYLVPAYRLWCSCSPDYLWLDDDLRHAGHMPLSYTCFCPNCLKIFAEDFWMFPSERVFSLIINIDCLKMHKLNALIIRKP